MFEVFGFRALPWLMALVVTAAGCDVKSRQPEPGALAARGSDAGTAADEVADGGARAVGTMPGQHAIFYRVDERGCWSHRESDASVMVTGLALDRLRAIAVASESFSELDPKLFGITAERLEVKRSVLMETLSRVTARARTDHSTLDLATGRPELTVDVITDVARRVVTSPGFSNSNTRLEVRLPGAPEIVVSSANAVPGRLPWTVEMGERSWQTYSTALPAALNDLLPASVSSHARLDAPAYWSDTFWKDDPAWRSLDKVRRARAALVAVASRAGFDELNARFRMPEGTSDSGAPDGAFSLKLSAKHDEFVDAVYWLIPDEERALDTSGADVLAAQARVTRAARRLPWLDEWKAAGGQRSIAMHVAGANLFQTWYGGDRARIFAVTPAWRHAGLPGDPTFQLSLLRAGQVVAILFLSDAAPGALVVKANHGQRMLQNDSANWLDRVDVSYNTRSPNYVLVDLQGGHEARSVPKNFPPLLQVTAERPASKHR